MLHPPEACGSHRYPELLINCRTSVTRSRYDTFHFTAVRRYSPHVSDENFWMVQHKSVQTVQHQWLTAFMTPSDAPNTSHGHHRTCQSCTVVAVYTAEQKRIMTSVYAYRWCTQFTISDAKTALERRGTSHHLARRIQHLQAFCQPGSLPWPLNKLQRPS